MTMSADVGNTTVDTIGVTNGEGTTEKWTNANNSSNDSTSYLDGLEDRLKMRSDQLEDLHLEAAIDAQLTAVVVVNSKKKYNIIQHQQTESEESISNHSIPIFDDYVNPHAVHNCLSPFVPTQSQRIEAMLDWVGLHNNDVFLDIGCGDGRVCVAAAKLKRCRAIGMDVSPLCMEMATKVAQEEGVERQCSFYQADATLDPEMLLALDESLTEALQSATVIFLYTYPTLLLKLIPLLSRLTNTYTTHNKDSSAVRAVVTLTYHLPDENVTLVKSDSQHDFRWYSQVRMTG